MLPGRPPYRGPLTAPPPDHWPLVTDHWPLTPPPPSVSIGVSPRSKLFSEILKQTAPRLRTSRWGTLTGWGWPTQARVKRVCLRRLGPAGRPTQQSKSRGAQRTEQALGKTRTAWLTREWTTEEWNKQQQTCTTHKQSRGTKHIWLLHHPQTVPGPQHLRR